MPNLSALVNHSQNLPSAWYYL